MTIYRCNFCASQFNSIYSLKRHIFSCHAFDIDFKITCNIDGCSEKLHDKFGIRQHVFRRHKGKVWNLPRHWYTKISVLDPVKMSSAAVLTDNGASCKTVCLDITQSVLTASLHQDCLPSTSKSAALMDVSTLVNKAIISEEDGNNRKIEDSNIAVYENTITNLSFRKTKMAQSLCKLKSECDLTETGLQIVQKWTENLLEESVKTMIGGIKTALPIIPSEVDKVLELGLAMANPFAGVKTESQLKKLLPCFVVSIYTVTL